MAWRNTTIDILQEKIALLQYDYLMNFKSSKAARMSKQGADFTKRLRAEKKHLKEIYDSFRSDPTERLTAIGHNHIAVWALNHMHTYKRLIEEMTFDKKTAKLFAKYPGLK